MRSIATIKTVKMTARVFLKWIEGSDDGRVKGFERHPHGSNRAH
jgi:hypothetical protein